MRRRRPFCAPVAGAPLMRSEEHTSELQSRELISYAVFCLKKKTPSHALNAHAHSAPSTRRAVQYVPGALEGNGTSASFFFFNCRAPPAAHPSPHTLSLHDALPI